MLNYLCQDDFSGKVVNRAQPWLINPLRTYCHVSAGWKINFVNYAEWCWFALTATFPLKLGQEKKHQCVLLLLFITPKLCQQQTAKTSERKANQVCVGPLSSRISRNFFVGFCC